MPPLLSGFATKSRLRAVLPYLHGALLDLGCGFTRLPQLLEPGQTYTGVDGWEEALAYNRLSYPQYTFHHRDLDREELELGEARFDTILMTAVLEHLHRPEHVLGEAKRYLASGGCLVMTTPSPFGDWVHQAGSRLRLFYSEDFVGHVKIFGKGDLTKLAQRTGYRMTVYRRFLFQTNQLILFTAET
jgi:SAM-dependent methyltransferase